MRLTAVLAITCLVALAFAGCSGKDKDGGATSSSSSSSRSSSSATSSSSSHSSTGTTTSSSSSTSTGPSNSPPTGSISAVTNGTLAAFTLNGTDPDGDALSWTLAFGDGNSTNGTTLPATASHNYTAGGNFTANFTVSDGRHTAAYNVTVAVGAGATATQDFAGSWGKGYNPACASDTLPYDAAPDTFAEAAAVAGTWNKPFAVEFASGAAQDHLLFLGADGKVLLHVTVGLPATSWAAQGTVPANTATLAFYGCGGLPGEDVTYHAG